MSKLLATLAISLPFACFAADVDNYWLAESGKTSYGTATSWSLDHMPTISENAIIDPHSTPSGTQNIDPFIVFATGETSTYTAGNLIIQNVYKTVDGEDKTFSLHMRMNSGTLNVNGDLNKIGGNCDGNVVIGVNTTAGSQATVKIANDINLGSIDDVRYTTANYLSFGGNGSSDFVGYGGIKSLTVGGNINIYGNKVLVMNVGTTGGTVESPDVVIGGVVELTRYNSSGDDMGSPTWFTNSRGYSAYSKDSSQTMEENMKVSQELNTVISLGGLKGDQGLVCTRTSILVDGVQYWGKGNTTLVFTNKAGTECFYGGTFRDRNDMSDGGTSQMSVIMNGEGTQFLAMDGNSYITGDITVNSGTLLLRTSTGSATTGNLYLNGGKVSGNGNLSESYSRRGNFAFTNVYWGNGTLQVDIDASGVEVLNIFGELIAVTDLLNVEFTEESWDSIVDGKQYTFISFRNGNSGGITADMFASNAAEFGKIADFSVTNSGVSVSFAAIPEPAHCALLSALFILALVAFMRRR